MMNLKKGRFGFVEKNDQDVADANYNSNLINFVDISANLGAQKSDDSQSYKNRKPIVLSDHAHVNANAKKSIANGNLSANNVNKGNSSLQQHKISTDEKSTNAKFTKNAMSGLREKVKSSLDDVAQQVQNYKKELVEAFPNVVQKAKVPAKNNFELGVLSLNAGNLQDAATRFWLATKFKSNFALAYYYLGYVCYLQSKPEKAVKFLTKVTKLRGESNRRAVELLEKILILHPNLKNYSSAKPGLARKALEFVKNSLDNLITLLLSKKTKKR